MRVRLVGRPQILDPGVGDKPDPRVRYRVS
jgi:hypothetical protein